MHPAFNRSARPNPGNGPSGVNAGLDDAGRTALHMATEKGDETALLRLLKIGANPNQTDKSGQTPAFEAVRTGNLAILRPLIDRGAKMDIRDNNGRSLVDWAIEQNATPAFIDDLRKLGADFLAHKKTRRTPLHTAAAQGRSDIVAYLQNRGADINARDDSGRTPLHLATSGGHLDAMKTLITLGANPNLRDTDIVTPLYMAADKGNMAALDILLAAPDVRTQINAHAAYSNGFTPLMVAASKNHADIIARLVAVGADVNQTDNQNRHSLFIAVETGQVDAVRKLLALGADAGKDVLSNSNKSPMVHWIHKEHYAEILTLLHGAGVEINTRDSNGQTALHRACDYTEHVKIKALLALGADANLVNDAGLRPIDELQDNYTYRNKDEPELIFALLKRGASPDISPSSTVEKGPIHHAAEYGHIESLKLLLAYNAQVDAVDRSYLQQTPFLIAAEHGKIEVAQTLLAQGANPRKTDRNKRNALHLAAYNGNTDMMNVLIGLPGLDINAPDGEGLTALHHACLREKPEAVKLLIQNGADPKRLDKMGMTALHRAMSEGNDDVLDAFRDSAGTETDWNIASAQDGETPLHLAIKRGLIAPVEKLLDIGADPMRPNQHGQTALHTAIAEGKDALAILLIDTLKARNIAVDSLVDDKGWTPLHHAVLADSNHIAEALLEAGADLHAVTSDGDTPLHIAAQVGDYSMTALLAEKRGARTTVVNKAGESPIDVTIRKDDESLFNLLLPFAVREEEAALKAAKTETPAPKDDTKPAATRNPRRPKPPGPQ